MFHKNRYDRLIFIIAFVVVWFPSSALAHDFEVPGGQSQGSQPQGEGSPGGPPIQGGSTGGEPVYLHNGEFAFSMTNFKITDRSMPVEFKLTYRSFSERNGRYGYGWTMNYDAKLRPLWYAEHTVDQRVIRLDEMCRRLTYVVEQNTDPNEPMFSSPFGVYDSMKINRDGTTTVQKKDGTIWKFDINGNLSSITDRNGNSITFEYDHVGLLPIYGKSKYMIMRLGLPLDPILIAFDYKLVRIHDDLGRAININYDNKGRMSSVTDFAGRTWFYTYDANTDDLIAVATPPTEQYPSGLTSSFTYDPNHKLISVTDANGQTYVVNYYDDQDRVVRQTYGGDDFSFEYQSGNKTVVTDRKGFHREIVHNASGNPISETVLTAGLRPGDPASYTTTKEYNQNMDLTRIIYPAGNCVDYTYDNKGNLLKICRKPTDATETDDPCNIVTILTYEPRYNFIKTITDPNGNVTTYTYDYEDPNYGTQVGNLRKITYPTIGTETPEVSFTYNEFGQLETTKAPDGIVTKYEYYGANEPNGPGLLKKVIADYGIEPNCLNTTTEFSYDVLGNVVKTTDAVGNVKQFVYDNLGQLTQSITPSPFKYVTNFWYNKNKNLTQIDRQTSDANHPWQTTGFICNVLDKLETQINPLGYVTSFEYDKNENRSLVQDAENNNSVYVYDERDLLWKATDALGNTTEYNYDGKGNLKTIKDAKGNITTYTYDSFDRLIEVTYPDDSNETYTYDKNSNLIDKTNRRGQTITYQYDKLNRLTQKTPSDRPTIQYSYDIASRLTNVNDGSLITSYQYDRLGRITQITYPDGKQVAYEYDALGRRTKLIYPDSTFITYYYDALSRLTDEKDANNTILAHYTYDALSRRQEADFANGTHATYDYDIANRLINLGNNGSSWNKTFAYTYDNVDNRKRMTVDASNVHNYTYDNIYQLTNVQYPTTSNVTYNYDVLGNRTSVANGGITTYSSNNLNQYTAVGGTSFAYDRNGNLTSDGTNTYVYDSENRLISATMPSHTAGYVYDSFGKRISKTIDGVTIKYLYDGDQVIAEYDAGGALIRKYVYGPDIDEPVAMIAAGQTYYYAFDGLGSVASLSNSTGGIVETYSYDVFGKPDTISTVGNRFMFTGREYDSETGLYYYRARYYSPQTGRFLQADPIGYHDTFNLYTYVNNNPVNWLDPYGLCKDSDNGFHPWKWWTELVTSKDPQSQWSEFWRITNEQMQSGNDWRFIALDILAWKSVSMIDTLADTQATNGQKWEAVGNTLWSIVGGELTGKVLKFAAINDIKQAEGNIEVYQRINKAWKDYSNFAKFKEVSDLYKGYFENQDVFAK